MATKIDDMKVQLAALSTERDVLDSAIEEMIASMAEVPAEQRKVGDWSPNGAMTKKYLDLTNRQAEVEAEIVDLGRAIMESDEPASSLH
jgi:hypothetical protein